MERAKDEQERRNKPKNRLKDESGRMKENGVGFRIEAMMKKPRMFSTTVRFSAIRHYPWIYRFTLFASWSISSEVWMTFELASYAR